MRARVALQVERVIESLATEGAEVAFDVRVTFEVTVQQTRQVELLATDLAFERIVAGSCRLTGTTCSRTHQLVTGWTVMLVMLHRAVVKATSIAKERIFDPMSSIHKFDRVQDVRGDPCTQRIVNRLL